jgi:hypothetical protein
LEGIGHEQGTVPSPDASNLDAVTDAWQKTLIFKKSRWAQTNFRSGTAILQPDMKIIVGQKRGLTNRTLHGHGIVLRLGPNKRNKNKHQSEQERISFAGHRSLPGTGFWRRCFLLVPEWM